MRLIWQDAWSYAYNTSMEYLLPSAIERRVKRQLEKFDNREDYSYFYVGASTQTHNGLWIPLFDCDNYKMKNEAIQNLNDRYVVFQSSDYHYWIFVDRLYLRVNNACDFIAKTGGCHSLYFQMADRKNALIVRAMPKNGQYPKLIYPKLEYNLPPQYGLEYYNLQARDKYNPEFVRWIKEFLDWWDGDVTNMIRANQILHIMKGDE